MKYILLMVSGLLVLAVTSLPIGYYTFLRIVVTITAVVVIVTEIKKGNNYWVVLFCIIGIIFNPIIPIYLNDKSKWIPIDLISALIFGIKAFSLNKKKLE